jgi:thioredoxin 1
MSQYVTAVSDDTFEADVLEADVPVMVDFWAEWCGPCRMLSPVVDEMAELYQGRLKVVKMNVDENSTVPQKFGIRGIPTLMVFKEGQLESTKVGSLTKSQLQDFLEGCL